MKSHLKQIDMRVIEIREDSLRSLAENVEKMLRYAGKSMQCIEDLHGGEMMGERRDYDREYDRDEERGRYAGEMYGDRRRGRYY